MEAPFDRATQGSNSRSQTSDMRGVYDPDSLLRQEVGDLYQFQIFSELGRAQDLGHDQSQANTLRDERQLQFMSFDLNRNVERKPMCR